MKWIDAEWIFQMLWTTHTEARADRIQSWPFLNMPNVKIKGKMISAWLYEEYAKMWWLKDHPRERYFGTWVEICELRGNEAHCDFYMVKKRT
jgi:hypothetical protein